MTGCHCYLSSSHVEHALPAPSILLQPILRVATSNGGRFQNDIASDVIPREHTNLSLHNLSKNAPEKTRKEAEYGEWHFSKSEFNSPVESTSLHGRMDVGLDECVDVCMHM